MPETACCQKKDEYLGFNWINGRHINGGQGVVVVASCRRADVKSHWFQSPKLRMFRKLSPVTCDISTASSSESSSISSLYVDQPRSSLDGNERAFAVLCGRAIFNSRYEVPSRPAYCCLKCQPFLPPQSLTKFHHAPMVNRLGDWSSGKNSSSRFRSYTDVLYSETRTPSFTELLYKFSREWSIWLAVTQLQSQTVYLCRGTIIIISRRGIRWKNKLDITKLTVHIYTAKSISFIKIRTLLQCYTAEVGGIATRKFRKCSTRPSCIWTNVFSIRENEYRYSVFRSRWISALFSFRTYWGLTFFPFFM